MAILLNITFTNYANELLLRSGTKVCCNNGLNISFALFLFFFLLFIYIDYKHKYIN